MKSTKIETKVDDVIEMSEEGISQKVQNFSDLLDQIENTTSKKKKLWKEIYENAVSDRLNAFFLFKELYGIVTSKPMEHAVHDKSISSYLERMAKCNDQLIKLADLIEAAEKQSNAINYDEMYSKIEDGNRQ